MNLISWLVQAQSELVPRAVQEDGRRRRERGRLRLADASRLFDRVRSMDTDARLRAWLHDWASLRQWQTLSEAIFELNRYFYSASPKDHRAMDLMREVVSCQTLLMVARLSLRGPLGYQDPRDPADPEIHSWWRNLDIWRQVRLGGG